MELSEKIRRYRISVDGLVRAVVVAHVRAIDVRTVLHAEHIAHLNAVEPRISVRFE